MYIHIMCLFIYILAPIIGHVGDGNFHSMLLVSNNEELSIAKQLAINMAR